MQSYFSNDRPLFPKIIERHGAWLGRKQALITPKLSLDWRTFDQQTSGLAATFYDRGIRRGDRLGVVMSNGAAMALTLVAAMKCGAVTVPINLSVSDDTIVALLTDADIAGLVLTDDQAGRVASLAFPDAFRLELPADGALPDPLTSNSDNTYKAESPEADTLMNIIYSSGTTGMPKGIAHAHQGRLDWTYDIALALRYHADSRTLFTIGLYSNISWVGFLSTLLLGGTLVIQPAFEARDTLAIMAKERITNGSMVPLQFQRLLDADPDQRFDPSHLSALMSCGSPLPYDLKQMLFDRWGPKVIELYGLTEGLITTLQPGDAFSDTSDRLKSVGKPLPGTTIKLLNDENEEVATGQPGEIVGTGRITMPGYWRREDASKDSSWTDGDSTVWLRTGDIGVLDEDGFLTLVDRKKDMILSGGQNIYPQDIEATARQHPLVRDVAVIGAKSSVWGETPIAFIEVETADGAIMPDTELLRAEINKQLGKQQRLKDLEIIDEIPRNPAGKILKQILRTRVRERCYD